MLSDRQFVFMEDWDLQAVVRGCSSSTDDEAFINMMMNNPAPPSLFAPLRIDDRDQLLNFPAEIFDTWTTDFDELEGLYKPFYDPVLHQTLSPQNNTILGTTTTTSLCVPRSEEKERQRLQRKKPSAKSGDATSTATKLKKRKNQHKKVIQQVKEDDLSSDMWAWRKYGQKPIKGSPYPRSYYRCSSLKGCSARKQVERSSADPSVFIITYTFEHSHAHPVRRNSLAGGTRIKPSAPPKAATLANIEEPNNIPKIINGECSAKLETVFSPTAPPAAFIEDELTTQQASIKINEELDEQNLVRISESNENFMPDHVVFSDELFPSLEELEGLLLDEFTHHTIPS